MRVYEIWNNEQPTQKDCKDVMKLCREKICRAKAELEFHLATAITDNKNIFTNINNRSVKENVNALLDTGENSHNR